MDLASKLPESIKNAGVIKIGVDASYAPNEFLAGDGKTVQGMDVDRLQCRSPAKFGVKTEWHPADFGSIINGVNGKKYDMGISSFTINPERMKQVNMVSYFSAGTQWATAKGNPKGVDPDNACGKNIAVQSNTTQDMTDLPVRQKKCGSNKINVLSFKDQSQATAAVVSGKADAMLADSPVVAYAVKQSGGKLEPLGDIYEAAPYGYVLPKDETEFAQAIVEALKEIDKDGAYKAALEKWGVEQGAISDFAVNPSAVMTTTTEARPAVSDDRPGLIHAKPVRHPGRWVAIAVIAVLALMFLNMVIFNPAFNWPLVFQAMNQSPVIEGFWKGTILVTILSMIFGVAAWGGARGDAAVRQPRSQGRVVALHVVLPGHPPLRAADDHGSARRPLHDGSVNRSAVRLEDHPVARTVR